jgi:tetratricopeptide (TPR) repeat protein
MLAGAAYFAFEIYKHILTLKDPEQRDIIDTDEEQPPRTAVAFSTFSAEDLLEKADVAYEEEDYQKALALLNEANEKASGNSEVLFKIGYILQKTGDNEESLKYYKEALEVDKENEFIHNSMASIYRENGEFTSAKMHLKASLDIDANNPITYYNYGNLLVDMNHNEEAIEMYKKALEIDPEFEEAAKEIENLKSAN